MTFDPAGEEFVEAVAMRNGGKICLWLDQGMSPEKRVGEGTETLLHLAAAWGDAALCAKLLSCGADPLVPSKWGETPEDVAIYYGFDGIAADLRSKAAIIKSKKHIRPAFSTLAEMRSACRKDQYDYFFEYAVAGNFEAVAELAGKSGGFEASDLLGKGATGDSALLKLCQSGQLGSVLKTELWPSGAEEFQRVWARVPQDYRGDFDAEDFKRRLRLEKIQSARKFRLDPG